ncbi:MAG: FAD:protein FMN transferase [Clostridia bacterium]|nr:FAD:protein FMN transferase [Clostridia bacterium]
MLILLLIATSFPGCREKEKKATETAMCLDTIVTVTCYADTQEKADKAAKAAISEVQRIELLLSAYIETSDIYQINQNAATTPVKVSDETVSVLSKALDFCEKTSGAFDITIKPLVELWNIKAENPQVPTDEQIGAARDKVDYKSVVIEDGYVRFLKEGMKIDLGGAAKGYAADKVFEVLKKHGIKNALIDLGGNIYAMGRSESDAPWKIGLQDPDKERGEHFYVMELSDKTCVTSGSYERYFEKDGKIYHHIIDPETGYPADGNLLSVSVSGDSSFEADMLSTAIFVMGTEEFEKIKSNFNYDKYVVVTNNNGTSNHAVYEKQ